MVTGHFGYFSQLSSFLRRVAGLQFESTVWRRKNKTNNNNNYNNTTTTTTTQQQRQQDQKQEEEQKMHLIAFVRKNCLLKFL